MKRLCLVLALTLSLMSARPVEQRAWIRINLLGYKPDGIKVAVWCAKEQIDFNSFELIDATSRKVVFTGSKIRHFGSYSAFKASARLNFSSFTTPGTYVLRAGDAESPPFDIGENVYAGAADYCLRYMRQQRSGFNPFLKDSCHTHDGYTMYGPMKDSTHIDVSGGWHDATDYLQYSMTSANATYHLLAAFRDFPSVFSDKFSANGLAGGNGIADVMDEAHWGLSWLLKMHPRPDWMFNQLADDRDHVGFRLPNRDKANYGRGKERPVYFITGEIQGLNKYKNRTKGTSSTAAKFSSAFSLGSRLTKEPSLQSKLKERAISAYNFAMRKPGNTQTASYLAPYFYEEDNWVDDMELAAAEMYNLANERKWITEAYGYARQERQTPWLGKDTASHYQWYPFINVGHYELAKIATGSVRRSVIEFYRDGIESVSKKAMTNAFLRGVPFIWCSNNLQTSFAIQCYWYRILSGDNRYEELEQAAFDFLFGCNPWGTSMVTGLPMNGDYPDDPHSGFNFLYGFQTWGGLVDGPVYGSIYKQQRGVSIAHGDEYAPFQSDYVVYHDDFGDYATNEPTMDGTASMIYLLAAKTVGNQVTEFRDDVRQKRQ